MSMVGTPEIWKEMQVEGTALSHGKDPDEAVLESVQMPLGLSLLAWKHFGIFKEEVREHDWREVCLG